MKKWRMPGRACMQDISPPIVLSAGGGCWRRPGRTYMQDLSQPIALSAGGGQDEHEGGSVHFFIFRGWSLGQSRKLIRKHEYGSQGCSVRHGVCTCVQCSTSFSCMASSCAWWVLGFADVRVCGKALHGMCM